MENERNSRWPAAARLSLASLALASVAPLGYAGKISSVVEPVISGCAAYYGGWNLDNVAVYLNPESPGNSGGFMPQNGCYTFLDTTDHSYYADVEDGLGTVVGRVLAKDWPIGEPPGIKVVNDDFDVKNDKPENCIMSTSYLDGAFLDSDAPEPVLCSGPYQSHKRFKVAMLPSIFPAGSATDPNDVASVDLVFNVEDEEGIRPYQVFQKINNWTDLRLTGFTIEVGFGVGESFVAAETEDLTLSVPDNLWSGNQLANFSAGLFGPLDTHGQVGFYDNKTRAGFYIDEYGTDDGNMGSTKLHATKTLGSNYDDLPRGVQDMNQFGSWLPNIALPYGIFFDDDGNPDTDAQLVAWYGYNPQIEGLGWMRGVADKFEAVAPEVIEDYGQSLFYTMDIIDDLVNVGLNYVVNVGDITTFPTVEDESSATFTIHITPTAQHPQDEFPPYVENGSQVDPVPWLSFTSNDAEVALQPGPVFEIGQVLTARVGDANAELDSDGNIQVDACIEEECAPLTLYELGEKRHVFAANLPISFSEEVTAGTVVEIRYDDAGTSKNATSTAVDPVDPPVSYDVAITNLTVPESLFDGLSRNIKVNIANDNKSPTAPGVVRLSGESSDGLSYVFDDIPFALDPGKKTLASFRWEAELKEDIVPATVDWVAEIIIDGILIDSAEAATTVEVKKGKNSNK